MPLLLILEISRSLSEFWTGIYYVTQYEHFYLFLAIGLALLIFFLALYFRRRGRRRRLKERHNSADTFRNIGTPPQTSSSERNRPEVAANSNHSKGRESAPVSPPANSSDDNNAHSGEQPHPSLKLTNKSDLGEREEESDQKISEEERPVSYAPPIWSEPDDDSPKQKRRMRM